MARTYKGTARTRAKGAQYGRMQARAAKHGLMVDGGRAKVRRALRSEGGQS